MAAMKITPEFLASQEGGCESSHQKAVVLWSMLPENRALRPMLEWLHSVPNGGERTKSVASQMKQEGVKSGVPDLCLPVPVGGYHGLYIEMKKPNKPGTRPSAMTGPSDNQVRWITHLHTVGYAVRVCWSWEAARDTLIAYLDHAPLAPFSELALPSLTDPMLASQHIRLQ